MYVFLLLGLCGVVWRQPERGHLRIASIPQPPLLRAVDLNHDTVLHNNVHRPKAKSAKRISNLIQRFVAALASVRYGYVRLMYDRLRHDNSSTQHRGLAFSLNLVFWNEYARLLGIDEHVAAFCQA